MIISVIGETDKRPFMYTLLRICQYMGDVLLVSDDRHYKRLIEEPEEDVEVYAGHFQNTFIVVTDKTPDEAMQAVGYEPEDYEFVIYDNQIDATSDLIVYVTGDSMSEWEKEQLDYLEEGDYITIGLGFGKKNMVPYSTNMFKNVELVESKLSLLCTAFALGSSNPLDASLYSCSIAIFNLDHSYCFNPVNNSASCSIFFISTFLTSLFVD